ncbi:MAG: hypothetical protein ACRDIY_14675 [Chloroflexota bacterium]
MIFTTREPTGVWAWLEKHGMAQFVDDVSNVKIPAFAYVDDRAIRFRGNYRRVFREIERFHPYWDHYVSSRTCSDGANPPLD